MDNPNKTQHDINNIPPIKETDDESVKFWRDNKDSKPCRNLYDDDAYKHRLTPIDPYVEGAHVYNPAFLSHSDKTSRLNTLALPPESKNKSTSKKTTRPRLDSQ